MIYWREKELIINPFRCDRLKSNDSDLVIFAGFIWSQSLSDFNNKYTVVKVLY